MNNGISTTLKLMLAEEKKQTELIARWMGQDKDYHKQTLNKMDRGVG